MRARRLASSARVSFRVGDPAALHARQRISEGANED